MARLADDAFGHRLRRRAVDEGLDLSAAPTASEPTTLAVVGVDAEGRPTYDFYVDGTADWHWTAAELRRIPATASVLHFGSIASWTSPGDTHIASAVRRVHAAGRTLISYDPNIRPLLLRDRERARTAVGRSVALAHLVKASTEDLAWLYPAVAPDEVAERWLALGAITVVVTDGAAGASAFTTERPPIHRGGLQVALVDTVGAGDSFTSALIAALVRSGIHSPERLQDCRAADLERAVEHAIRASALTCRRAGADPPTTQQLTEFEEQAPASAATATKSAGDSTR